MRNPREARFCSRMIWLLVAVALLAAYQTVVVLMIRLGWRTPRVPHRRDPSAIGIAFETIRFGTAKGKSLHGWWIPAEAAGAALAPCLVLVHGWGRNVERMLPWIEMLHPAGYDLLAFDARHHGSSDADDFASMVKFSEDIRAAVDVAGQQRGASQGQVGVLGLSVGGAAAIHAAAHDDRIAAVATVGAFAAPSARVLLGRGWWLLAPGVPLAFRLAERRIGFRFRDAAPERHIGRARARFLVIHGVDDVVIPASNARRLAAASASARAWVVSGRGHSDLHREPAMPATLIAFFGEALGGRTRRAASA